MDMVRYFIREAGIEDILIKSLNILLCKGIRAQYGMHLEQLDPSKTMLELSNLKESDFCHEQSIYEIPNALARHANIVSEKLRQVNNSRSKYVNAKFLGIGVNLEMLYTEMHLLISISVWKFSEAFRIQE